MDGDGGMAALESAHVAGRPLSAVDQLCWVAGIPLAGAHEKPSQPAIIFADRGVTISYAELERQTNACVAELRARGLKAGDRIAYLGPNNDLYFPTLFGAIRAGIVLVPLNFRLTAPEIEYQLMDSDARLLIHDPAMHEKAQAAIAGLKAPPTLLPTEGSAAEPPGTANLRTLLAREAAAVPVPTELDQVILQLYTSGTTGKPKGAQISHGALSLARHAELIAPELAHLTEACMSLSAMPNFHVGGMSWVLMGLVRKGTVVVTADPLPANMLKLLREFNIRHSFIVPTVLRAIVDALKAGGETAPQMDGIYYGAMPIGASLLDEIIQCFKCPLVQFFGMTENTGSVTMLGPADHDPARPHLLKSVGKPYPGMSLEIRGQDRQVLPPRRHGEIWVQSPTLMTGYWNLPEKTSEALIDGWYATGDGGYVDEEGFLFLTDRIKDMIVSGGENVYPVEVEEALRQHPAVLDAAVIGLPDGRWGEMVVTVVELRPGHAGDIEAILAHVRLRLAGYKCPKRVHFDALPRTASGKVQRAALKTRLIAGH